MPAAIPAPHGAVPLALARIAPRTTASARLADSPASIPLADQRTSQAFPAHTRPARKDNPISPVKRRINP